MLRARTFQRRTARLALAAILLIALAPTVSRALEAHQAVGPAVVVTQLCTAVGLQTKVVTAILGTDSQGGSDTIPSQDGGDACGYCSLVVPPPVLLLLLCGLLLSVPVAPSFQQHAAFLQVLRNLRGLGAQAPPITL